MSPSQWSPRMGAEAVIEAHCTALRSGAAAALQLSNACPKCIRPATALPLGPKPQRSSSPPPPQAPNTRIKCATRSGGSPMATRPATRSLTSSSPRPSRRRRKALSSTSTVACGSFSGVAAIPHTPNAPCRARRASHAAFLYPPVPPTLAFSHRPWSSPSTSWSRQLNTQSHPQVGFGSAADARGASVRDPQLLNLAPRVTGTLSVMVGQCERAIAHLHRRYPTLPIAVVGHSAGGHLAVCFLGRVVPVSRFLFTWAEFSCCAPPPRCVRRCWHGQTGLRLVYQLCESAFVVGRRRATLP